jgi:hypothetical protein
MGLMILESVIVVCSWLVRRFVTSFHFFVGIADICSTIPGVVVISFCTRR